MVVSSRVSTTRSVFVITVQAVASLFAFTVFVLYTNYNFTQNTPASPRSMNDAIIPKINHQLDADADEDATRPRRRTRAVVHMGPHKTGTTTIQHQSMNHLDSLEEDGYEMPWVAKRRSYLFNDRVNGRPPDHGNQVNFATCFVPPSYPARQKHPCDPDLLLAGLEIAQQNKSLFVSAEIFDAIDKLGVKALSSYLAHWDEVTIVLYYRHYYDWIVSLFNQIIRGREFTNEKSSMQKWDMNIVDFILKKQKNSNVKHAAQLKEMVSSQFSMDNIVVINFHDKDMGGPDEQMFCHAIQDTIDTCKAIRRNAKKGKGQIHDNKKDDDIDYGDLAYGAHKAGLIKIKRDGQDMKRVIGATKAHQEQVLKRTSKDFQRVCLPPNAIKKNVGYILGL